MPEYPNRKSTRLGGYDYGQNGLYFVTICVQNRRYLFGAIRDGSMICNEACEMLAYWWHKLTTKFANVQPDIFVVMPNHFHGILIIDQPIESSEQQAPLPRMIQWFKTMTTNAYMQGVNNRGWQAFEGKLWQRSYHDQIIRDERTLLNIQQYIQENPLRWEQDTFFDRK